MNETDLRDCFAMFALNGIIARGGLHPELMPEDCIARRSYEIADAMIEARKAKDKSGIIAVKRSSTKKEK
jgi:hypothetical protein